MQNRKGYFNFHITYIWCRDKIICGNESRFKIIKETKNGLFKLRD